MNRYSGGNQNYTGYKFRIKYGAGASGGPYYSDEFQHNYTQPTDGVTKTRDYKDTDVILPGGKYGVVVTKKNNPDHTVDVDLWFQDFSKESYSPVRFPLISNIILINPYGSILLKLFSNLWLNGR